MFWRELRDAKSKSRTGSRASPPPSAVKYHFNRGGTRKKSSSLGHFGLSGSLHVSHVLPWQGHGQSAGERASPNSLSPPRSHDDAPSSPRTGSLVIARVCVIFGCVSPLSWAVATAATSQSARPKAIRSTRSCLFTVPPYWVG